MILLTNPTTWKCRRRILFEIMHTLYKIISVNISLHGAEVFMTSSTLICIWCFLYILTELSLILQAAC